MVRYLPHFALVLAMLVWSTSFPALKIALSEYTPPQVMAGRMLAASLICLPLIPSLIRALRDRVVRRTLLVCVLCEPCLYFLCETFALRYTSSAQAGMVLALLPLSVAAGAWLLLGERPARRVWVGFSLAIAGVCWLTFGSVATDSSPLPLLGNLLEALAVLCATGYTLSVRRLSNRVPPTIMTVAAPLAGALFFLPLSLVPLNLKPVSTGLDLPSWAPEVCILYLGTIVTFTGYGLYNYGICRLSAGRAAAYTNLIPVLTLFMGVLWMGDVLLPEQYAASALVLLGVFLSQGGASSGPPEGSAANGEAGPATGGPR